MPPPFFIFFFLRYKKLMQRVLIYFDSSRPSFRLPLYHLTLCDINPWPYPNLNNLFKTFSTLMLSRVASILRT